MNHDRELLELAAKAAGLIGYIHEWINGPEFIIPGENPVTWNPLTDDGDALRLLAKMRELYGPILLALFEDRVECGDETTLHARVPIIDGDTAAAIREAITNTAAEIGKTMP